MKKVAKWLDRKAGAVWFSCFFNLAVLAGMMLLLILFVFITWHDITGLIK